MIKRAAPSARIVTAAIEKDASGDMFFVKLNNTAIAKVSPVTYPRFCRMVALPLALFLT